MFLSLKIQKKKDSLISLGMGASLGAAFHIRPFTTFIFCVYFLFFLLLDRNASVRIRNIQRRNQEKLRRYEKVEFIQIGLGFLPFLIIFLFYNHKLTGNFFTMGYFASNDIQFVRFQDSILMGFKNIIYACWRLFDGLFPLPASVSLFFMFLGIQQSKGRDRRYVILFILALFLHGILFFHQFRYFYSFSFFLHIYIYIGFDVFMKRISRFYDNSGKICLQWFTSLVLAGGIITLCTFAAVKKRWFDKVTTPYRDVKEACIENAVVFLKSVPVVYPMFYTRNSPGLNDSVLYVLDLGKKNIELMKYYPKRSFFIYDKERGLLPYKS